MMLRVGAFLLIGLVMAPFIAAGADLVGAVRDETGGTLPGVSVELRGPANAAPRLAVTDAQGVFRFDALSAGQYQLSFMLINFASVRRDIIVRVAPARVDVVLHLALSADVTVTGKRTFTNLADAERPAEDLVGIAQSASQGAITARQLEARPIMRTGEV